MYQRIVAGTDVRVTGTARFMLGNVPKRVGHHAPTDVLILQTS